MSFSGPHVHQHTVVHIFGDKHIYIIFKNLKNGSVRKEKTWDVRMTDPIQEVGEGKL